MLWRKTEKKVLAKKKGERERQRKRGAGRCRERG
jgi:hypothetical protein